MIMDVLIILPLGANVLFLDYYMPIWLWKRVKRLKLQSFFLQSTVKFEIINELNE